MNKEQMETLNVMQQVMRMFVISLIGESQVDPSRLATLLASAGAQQSLEPAARAMLADLATGVAMLGRARDGSH